MKNTILIIAVVLASYAAYGPLRLSSQPAQQQPATAALQQQLDDLQRTTASLVAAQEKDEARRPADPVTKSLTELGCKPNDPRFDNAPLIQPAIDAGYNIDVDGFYYTSPLKTPVGVKSTDGTQTFGRSCRIAGQGAGYRHGGKGVTGFAAFKSDQPCIIECPGTASPGQCMVIRDLCLLGGEKCDGIRVHGARTTTIENCVVRKCGGWGILVDPATGVYGLEIRNCSLLDNGIGLELRNGNSVCCFAASSTEIMGGRAAIVMNGWKRGAVFTAVACEGQSEDKVRLTDARASFIGCYFEGDSGKAGLVLKDSKATIVDGSIGGYKASGASQVYWVGDNVQAGTLTY